jgi:two-component system chemotaxis sensor kinase CheA
VARDPYRYFRIESRELLDALGRGVLDLEKGEGGPELVVGMLRLAHTLKGASRVVRQAPIASLAHAIEDVLAPYREKESAAISRENVERLLGLLDEIAVLLTALVTPADIFAGPAPAASIEPPGALRVDQSLKSVRVEIDEMDALLEGVFETHVRLASMRRELEELSRARALTRTLVELSPRGTRARSAAEELSVALGRAERNLSSGLDHADRETAQVRDRASQLRLLPASTVFAALERGARDAAEAVKRPIRFETSGGDHRLEANVLFALRDALLHVVRNAVAHGIEPESARRALGKPAVGSVTLDVQRRGNRIAFVCTDDGRGIDVEAVRRAAIGCGVATPAQAAALRPEQVHRLVLESGVTTTEKVTQVSGRGIGLDVLRSTVAQLAGEVILTSHTDRGTRVDVCVPLSISSISALVVEAGGATASVPLDSVRRTLRLAGSDIARSPEQDSVVVEGMVVPFLPLAAVLRGRRNASDAADRGARGWTAVVVEAGSRLAVLGVDRLVGRANIVVRPLPALAGDVPTVAGASLDAGGNPQLVLDPRALVDAAHATRRASSEVTSAETAKPPILVIDDSLTTRMLEQSILESAGYAVDLATSAEEALIKARLAPYGLFLVDVEMPGMDGFEFVSRTRADPALRTIPAILVTSRDAEQDRRRGAEVGAHAYIVKGEFDQGHLLQVIRQLVG